MPVGAGHLSIKADAVTAAAFSGTLSRSETLHLKKVEIYLTSAPLCPQYAKQPGAARDLLYVFLETILLKRSFSLQTQDPKRRCSRRVVTVVESKETFYLTQIHKALHKAHGRFILPLRQVLKNQTPTDKSYAL